MTANNRESFIFAFEGYTMKSTSSTVQEPNFGKGRGYPKSTTVQTSTDINPWLHVPPGSFLSTTHNRSVTRINALGTKEWDTLAYGAMSGQFTWTFNLDYKYIEPLLLVFEDYTYEAGIGTAPTKNIHKFKKAVGKRVPSFVLRRVILNRVAGGPDKSDEVTELYGCVVRNATFSKSSGTSQVTVTLTGIYADEKMWMGNLSNTDYAVYTGKLTEYMCMFAGDINDTNYVANTDSLEISIGNNLDGVYTTCSPFLSTYYEGLSDYEFSTSCYSTDPKKYKTRVYSGGAANTGDVHTGYNTVIPKAKGLTPMPLINLMSYSGSRHDDPTTYTNFSSYTSADEYAVFKITDCVIKSLTWPKSDGSAIQDNISSAMCKSIELTVKSTMEDLTTEDEHECASPVEPPNIDNNGNEYKLSGSTVTISKGSLGTGIIPDSSSTGGILSSVLGSVYSTVTTVDIGSGMTSIGSNAFLGCTSLTSVTLPDSITSIGNAAFTSCDDLSLTIAATTPPTLGTNALPTLTNKISIYVPFNSVSTYRAASGWSTYEYVIRTMPIQFTDTNGNTYAAEGYTVTVSKGSSGTGVIPDCSKVAGGILKTLFGDYYSTLQKVVFQSGMTSIGDNAFYMCITSVAISFADTITSIGDNAFELCSNLLGETEDEMVLPANLTAIGEYAFHSCVSIPSITFGNALTTIGSHAFDNVSLSLASVSLPASLTTIDDSAFTSCSKLRTMTLRSTSPPTLGTDAIPSGVTNIYVPSASVDTYKAASRWSSFADKISEIIE